MAKKRDTLRVKAPPIPIDQGGAQDGLPQPTASSVRRLGARMTGRLNVRSEEGKSIFQANPPSGPRSASSRLGPDEERDAIANLLASQGIINPTFEDYEAAREQVSQNLIVTQSDIPPPGGGLTLHARTVLEGASGVTGKQPSKAQTTIPTTTTPSEAKGDTSTTSSTPFDYAHDVPTTPEEARQILDYVPRELAGIRLTENGYVDANGELITDTNLISQFEEYETKLAIAQDVWNNYLADLQATATRAANDKAALVQYQAQSDIDKTTALAIDTERRLRDASDESTRAAAEWEAFQRQEKLKADLQAESDRIAREFAAAQNALDRAIEQGNLDEVVRHNAAMESLDEQRFQLERQQQAFLMMASIANNPAILFFARQSGLLQTLSDQFGLDFSMFGGGDPSGRLPFTLSDISRMSQSERRAAIGKVMAATGKSEADIMEELRRSAPGSSVGKPQRSTL